MCKDYEPGSKTCTLFFAAFQNRLLYAITGSTASELVIKRADAADPNMGLQSWSGDYPLQDDALTGKNYLGQLELQDLNRLVSMVLDFFEDQVERGWLVSLSEADEKLNEILTVNKRKMLPDGSRATAAQCNRHRKAQYNIFDKKRREDRKASALEHDPQKWIPVLRQRSCLNKVIEPHSDSIGMEKALADLNHAAKNLPKRMSGKKAVPNR